MTDQPQPAQQRLRITFGKHGSQKYIGHLDLAKTWERILRRAEISLSYSQGFNARPKIQMATALSLGVTSDCEILDIWLDRPVPLEGLAVHLMSVSPPGLPIFNIQEVPVKAPALQTLIESSIYLIEPKEAIDPDDLRQRVSHLLAQPELQRTRNDKPYDLRPLVLALDINEAGQLRAELALTNQGTGRPDELIDALGLVPATMSIHRIAFKLRS